MVCMNVDFKAVTLLLTRSAEERQQVLNTGDFVPPVRGAALPRPPPTPPALHSACGPALRSLPRTC